jgi:hypothetical protein
VLKTPNTGPYRIDCIKEKNVSLTELQTGKQVHSHIELIRPVSLKEFKLILTNQWDLHSQYTKSAQPMPTRSSFLTAHSLDKNAVIQAENTPEEIEDKIDLPAFFVKPEQGRQSPDPEPQPAPAPPLDPNPHLHADPVPELHHVADPDSASTAQENSSHHQLGEIEDEILQFNSFHIHEDVSNSYKKKLLLKQPAPKAVSFYKRVKRFFGEKFDIATLE